MFLLSSAKVSFTNMGPRAKPKLFSVSLTHNFQRGRQVCKQREGDWAPASLQLGPLLPSRTSGRPFQTRWKLF